MFNLNFAVFDNNWADIVFYTYCIAYYLFVDSLVAHTLAGNSIVDIVAGIIFDIVTGIIVEIVADIIVAVCSDSQGNYIEVGIDICFVKNNKFVEDTNIFDFYLGSIVFVGIVVGGNIVDQCIVRFTFCYSYCIV